MRVEKGGQDALNVITLKLQFGLNTFFFFFKHFIYCIVHLKICAAVHSSTSVEVFYFNTLLQITVHTSCLCLILPHLKDSSFHIACAPSLPALCFYPLVTGTHSCTQ